MDETISEKYYRPSVILPINRNESLIPVINMIGNYDRCKYEFSITKYVRKDVGKLIALHEFVMNDFEVKVKFDCAKKSANSEVETELKNKFMKELHDEVEKFRAQTGAIHDHIFDIWFICDEISDDESRVFFLQDCHIKGINFSPLHTDYVEESSDLFDEVIVDIVCAECKIETISATMPNTFSKVVEILRELEEKKMHHVPYEGGNNDKEI